MIPEYGIPYPRVRLTVPRHLKAHIHYDIATDIDGYAEWCDEEIDGLMVFMFRIEHARKAYRIAAWLCRMGVANNVHFDC